MPEKNEESGIMHVAKIEIIYGIQPDGQSVVGASVNGSIDLITAVGALEMSKAIIKRIMGEDEEEYDED